MDESNATCGKRLDSIGVENTEDNRRAYRELLVTTPGLGQYISGAILFEETLYQTIRDGKKFTDVLNGQNIVPGARPFSKLFLRSVQLLLSWISTLEARADSRYVAVLLSASYERLTFSRGLGCSKTQGCCLTYLAWVMSSRKHPSK